MKAVKFRTENPYTPSPSLIRRLETAYLELINDAQEDKSSLWQMITNKNIEIHNALLRGDGSAIEYLKDPGSTNLYYGVDNLAADILSKIPNESESEYLYLTNLIETLGQALGVANIQNPEQSGTRGGQSPGFEAVLERIANNCKNFVFPNPFLGEFGIESPYGLISYRAIQAFYQSELILRTCNYIDNHHVLEIGAGMGRTAFYSHLKGIQCTTVDLPLGLIGQALFFSATLGENSFRFENEPSTRVRTINLMSPREFCETSERYGLIINIDSLTEMDLVTASVYLKKITEKADYFLSINHDVNDFSVAELVQSKERLKRVYRSPYWLRQGYAEELYVSNTHRSKKKRIGQSLKLRK